ncbi:hypothetical protein V6N13_031109 [Hibiscus sabdariffa]|uniref:MBD domain-containing protein n=1 Tax=Hibiscus sabdariffa TaxID=183260 RepID=A0ABR2CLA9_9ROSI
MESGKEDVVCLQLHAPPGWTKKLLPKKRGTPKKNDIIFIAPTGEEISSKRQLEQYLEANPGGPAASELDWGTGETPRRSVRISEKVKAMPAPESTEPPRKRGRKSLASKKDNEEPETAPEGTKTKDVRMEEAEMSDKGNVEGDARKDENGNKDKPQDADSKTESITRETKHGEDANVSTSIKESENAEAVSEMLKEPKDGVKVDALEKGFEDATSEVKLQQPVDEAEKGLESEQHDRPGIGIITEELNNEVVGEDKAKHEISTAESEGAIKEKGLINCNEVQNITGFDRNSKNVEEATRNGSNGSNAVPMVKP